MAALPGRWRSWWQWPLQTRGGMCVSWWQWPLWRWWAVEWSYRVRSWWQWSLRIRGGPICANLLQNLSPLPPIQSGRHWPGKIHRVPNPTERASRGQIERGETDCLCWWQPLLSKAMARAEKMMSFFWWQWSLQTEVFSERQWSVQTKSSAGMSEGKKHKKNKSNHQFQRQWPATMHTESLLHKGNGQLQGVTSKK
jgi:hypothetical protein